MLQSWNSLTLFQQIMVFIAAPATIIIIIQLIMSLFGFSADDSFETGDVSDTDVSGDVFNNEGFFNIGGLRLISLRTVLAFLCVGGWLSLALSFSMHNALAAIIGALSGALTGFLIAFALHSAMKLQSSGNIEYKNAVSKTATVYIRIPPKRTGKGKINLTLQERFVEIDAVTDDGSTIETGLAVKVVELADENTVIVERL